MIVCMALGFPFVAVGWFTGATGSGLRVFFEYKNEGIVWFDEPFVRSLRFRSHRVYIEA